VNQTALVRWTLAGALTFAACAQSESDEQVIAVDTTRAFQTIDGWEATAWISEWACPPDPSPVPRALPFFTDTLFDLTVDLGINRIRVETRSGAERPDDPFAAYRSGRITEPDWEADWYKPINDNDDPLLIDTAGFHFGELDLKIRTTVLPLRERLEKQGERLHVTLNYVSFNSDDSALVHRNDPEEYAEFMLAAFQHIDRVFGFVPDAIEIVLEPDLGKRPWTPQQIGDAILATAHRFAGAGYHPEFIAPSTVSMATGIVFFDQLSRMPGVTGLLSEFSYHRYRNVSRQSIEAIGRIALDRGVRTAMLERRGAGYLMLHQDLALSNNSAWQQYALAGCAPDEPVGRLFAIDATDPEHPIVRTSERAKYFRQYFHYIRRGAVRVGAQTADRALDPLAFINADGLAVVVVKASRGRRFSIAGVPPGRYGITYTTGPNDHSVDQAAVPLPDIVIAPGQSLDTAIPDRGVITVFGRPRANPADSRSTGS